jgi:hypothetical protein
MRENNPRRHHFLPISYLQNFCSDEGDIYVYERAKPPRKSSPKQAAHIRDFYAYEGEDGKNFEIEKILSKFESDAAPVIQGIVNRASTNSHRYPTNDETKILRKLVALMFLRVPAGRNLDAEHIAPAVRKLFETEARDPKRFAELLKDVPDDEPLSAKERAELIENVRLRILNGFYNEPEPPGFRFYAMLHVANMIAEELRSYSCLIVLAPKHESFLTGDTPVWTGIEKGAGMQLGTAFADRDTSVWLPISNKICLLWKRGQKRGFAKIPPRGVRIMNRNVMRFTERFLYASQYSLKLADRYTRTPQMIFPGKNAFIPIWEGKPIMTDE